jgi:hypothetical protein
LDEGVSVTPWTLFTSGKDTVPIVQEAGWAQGPVWTGAENLASSGFDPQTVQPNASHYTDCATWPIWKVYVEGMKVNISNKKYVKREVKINYLEKGKDNGVKAYGEWR